MALVFRLGADGNIYADPEVGPEYRFNTGGVIPLAPEDYAALTRAGTALAAAALKDTDTAYLVNGKVYASNGTSFQTVGASTSKALGRKNPGVLVVPTESAPLSALQVVGTATVAKDASIARTAGGATLRITTPGAGSVDFNHIDALPGVLDKRGRVGLWVYVPDVTKVSTMVLKVSLGTDEFTDGVFQTYSFSDGDKNYSGWHFVAFAGSEFQGDWGVGDAGFPTLAVKRVRLTINMAAAGSVYVGNCYVGWQANATVLVTHDDGNTSWFKYAVPVLDALGLKASMSIVASLVNSNSAWVTTAELEAAYANGHDLCPHGNSALNTFATDAEAVADVAANKAFLDNLNLSRGTSFYVWPNGVYQRTNGHRGFIDGIKALGIKAARGTTSPRSIKLGAGVGDNRYLLPIIGGVLSDTVATMKARMDAVVANGETAFLMYHRITLANETTEAIDLNLQDFVEQMEYLAQLERAGKVEVITVSELIEAHGL